MSNSFKRYASEQYVDEKIALSDLSSIADYDQSDVSQPNYIKNRPFYTDSSSMVKLADISGDWQALVEGQLMYISYRHSPSLSLSVGEKFTIVIDGKEISGVLTGNGTDGYVGFGDTQALQAQDIQNINFIFECVYNSNYNWDTITVVYRTNTIPSECRLYSGASIVKKLDEKYIPDNMKPIWNNIQDNPFMLPEALYEWDEDVVYDERLLLPDTTMYYAKISDDYIDAEDIIGKTLYIKQFYDEVVSEATASIIEDYITVNDNGYLILDSMFNFIATDTTDPDSGLTLTRGVWVMDGWDTNGEEQSSRPLVLKILGDPVVQIDEKYIPSTIARVTSLTATDDGEGNVTLSFIQ